LGVADSLLARVRSTGRQEALEEPAPVRLLVDGVMVEVPRGFDTETLSRVLEVLVSREGSR